MAVIRNRAADPDVHFSIGFDLMKGVADRRTNIYTEEQACAFSLYLEGT